MKSWHRHSLRFMTVGVGSNLSLYVLYLLVTWLGIGHKTAMTALYLVGMMQTFVLNKAWTFEYRGKSGGAMRRFIVAYALGYVVNFAILQLFVDVMLLPHQMVQAAAILVVAFMMFMLQRCWVFASTGTYDCKRST